MLEVNLKTKYVKDSLVVLVLSMLKKGPMSGNEVIRHIHAEYGAFISPGVIYPLLHSLVLEGLIKTEPDGKSKNYKIASSRKVENVLSAYLDIQRLLIKDIGDSKRRKVGMAV